MVILDFLLKELHSSLTEVKLELRGKFLIISSLFSNVVSFIEKSYEEFELNY